MAEVGRSLFMSPSTVKTHIGKIYEKLGAHNRASAVIAAVRLGLISDNPGRTASTAGPEFLAVRSGRTSDHPEEPPRCGSRPGR